MILLCPCGERSRKHLLTMALHLRAATDERIEVADEPTLPATEWPNLAVVQAITAYGRWAGMAEGDAYCIASIWLAHWRGVLQSKRPRVAVSTGSEHIEQAALRYQCDALGIPFRIVTAGWFPRYDGPAYVVTDHRHLAMLTPDDCTDALAHECDSGRISAYAQWWRAHKRTKHEAAVEPIECSDIGGVTFGQVRTDVAVWATGLTCERIWQLGRAHGGRTWKPHPLDDWMPAGAPSLPARASAHSILPRCEVVVTASSAVGAEAWLYGRRTVVLGRPWYAFDDCGVHGQQPTDAHTEARMRVLDWFIFEKQVVGPQGVIARLQECQWQSMM